MVKHNIFKYILNIGLIISYFIEPVQGQRWKLRRYEAGFGIGTTQVFGDIGGTADTKTWFGLKDIQINETRMAFGGFGRYKITPVYSLKVNTILGFGNGTDENSRNNRGRSFKTTLFELSVQGEYYIIGEERRFRSEAMYNRRGMINNYASFNAYGFIGVGAIYYNPKISSTQPLIENVDIISGYSKFGAVFPFGLGLKYIIDDRWLVNAELGYRLTTSDFIDGHTQAIDSKHKDVYYFLTISVSYRLDSSRRGLPAFLDKSNSTTRYNRKGGGTIKRPKSKKEALE
jgi:hypothetical protein